MNTLIVIPARLESTRLPQKALADINGKPMVARVLECAIKANAGKVLVACDSILISDVVLKAGGEAILTDPALPSGTDRVKAAVDLYDPARKYGTIVNLQGDMPYVPPAIITGALDALHKGGFDIGTAAFRLNNEKEQSNPNVVKAAIAGINGQDIGRALYFSRSRIPHGEGEVYSHIGIYTYSRMALERFVSLPPSPLEVRERLEQLRAMEDGLTIGVKIVTESVISVDTPADLEAARRVGTL